MNPLYETLSEMTLGARLLRGFTAVNQTFNPKGMLHCVMFNLNAKGMQRLNQLMTKEKLAESGELFDEEVHVIDLEKDYFTRPKYVEKYQADLNKLISEWMLDRTDDNIYRVTQHIDNNYKNSLDSWRLKAIGATNDLLVLEPNDDIDDDGRWRMIAIASENIPLQWFSAFLREVGEDNRISWYGYNHYTSSYGTAAIVEGNNLLIQMTPETLLPVLRELAGSRIPQEDDDLTPMQLHEMLGSIDELIGTIRKRNYLHKTKPHTNVVELIIENVEKIGLSKGEDYLNLMVYLDQILNQLNYTSELGQLDKARAVLEDRVTKRTREIYTRELEEGLATLRANDPRFKDFVLQDDEKNMFRFYLMYGGGGVNALIRVYDERQKKLEEPEQKLSEHGKTVKAYQDNQAEKAKWSDQEELDNIIAREREMAEAYISEAKAVALNTSTYMNGPDAVLNFLIKVYQEKGAAQRIHGDLCCLNPNDAEFKELYFEIIDFCLSSRLQYQFTQAEIGSFYNWLETVNAETATMSKTAKARKLIDDLVEREEADLKKYIDEAEELALTKDVSLDYAGVLILLEKLLGEYAKETLEELVEHDSNDEDWKSSYLEIASLSLKPTNFHKVSREELGAFYLWLNTTRHELKKDK